MKLVSLECAVASMRNGTLLDRPQDAGVAAQLADLAATLPEIFGTIDQGCLERIASRLGATSYSSPLTEVLLLSESHVHVVQPQAHDRAVLAIGPADRSVGLVLSQLRAELSARGEDA